MARWRCRRPLGAYSLLRRRHEISSATLVRRGRVDVSPAFAVDPCRCPLAADGERTRAEATIQVDTRASACDFESGARPCFSYMDSTATEMTTRLNGRGLGLDGAEASHCWVSPVGLRGRFV